MDVNQCISLYNQYFKIDSYVAAIKKPDLYMKSHVFFYQEIFKDVGEIRVFGLSTKNLAHNIRLDVYFVSKELDGLLHGYFRIKPQTDEAVRLFKDISLVFTDMSKYLYYAYQQNELIRVFLISGDIKNALSSDAAGKSDDTTQYDTIKHDTLLKMSEYKPEELGNFFLDKNYLEKYIDYFIKFNPKCSENVKMFLISALSNTYRNHICIINSANNLINYVDVSYDEIKFIGNANISIYSYLEYVAKQNFIMLIKFNYDFGA